jgi:hypothetical protein
MLPHREEGSRQQMVKLTITSQRYQQKSRASMIDLNVPMMARVVASKDPSEARQVEKGFLIPSR